MRSVRNSNPSTAVILLTAFGTVPEAVQAIHGGACDHLTKPFAFDQLQSAVNRVMNQGPKAAPASGVGIVGHSPSLLRALDRARHAALANALK